MKILSICGSPRKNGTSSVVADQLLQYLNVNGNEIIKYHLNSMNIKGCQECFYCRKNKTDICAVKDDLTEVLQLAKTVDLLVVSTPVFYADISAQLKCFIDRTWSYFGKTGSSANHLPRNRSLVYIQAYGYADANIYNSLFDKYKRYFNMFGFDRCYLVNAYGVQHSSSELINKDEVSANIKNIASNLLRGC